MHELTWGRGGGRLWTVQGGGFNPPLPTPLPDMLRLFGWVVVRMPEPAESRRNKCICLFIYTDQGVTAGYTENIWYMLVNILHLGSLTLRRNMVLVNIFCVLSHLFSQTHQCLQSVSYFFHNVNSIYFIFHKPMVCFPNVGQPAMFHFFITRSPACSMLFKYMN